MSIQQIIFLIKRQLLPFLLYVAMSSLLLFNRDGGADIVFGLFLSLLFILHIIGNAILIIVGFGLEKPNRWRMSHLIIFVLLAGCFFYHIGYYLAFMWWLTSLLQ